jgi:hypothetical protein
MVVLRLTVLALSVSVALAVIGAAGAAKPTSATCPNGFDIGAVSFDDYLQLPRTAAAIDAGLIDADTILAGLAFADKNGDQIICVQLSQGKEVSNKAFVQYMYNVADDTASAS